MRVRFRLALLALVILAALVVRSRATAQEADEDLERFIPTEEVSADLPVSFPVDI